MIPNVRRETEYVAGLVGQVLNAQHRFGDMIQDKGKVSIDLVTVIQKALGVLEVGADLSVFHLDLRSPHFTLWRQDRPKLKLFAPIVFIQRSTFAVMNNVGMQRQP